MSDAHETLAALRDIREPAPPEGSPPWLPLAVALLAALVAALLLRRRWRRRRAWLEEALAALETARGHRPAAALVVLAGTLRRVMRHRHGDALDALDGEAWLERLDEEFATDWFTRGAGRAFGEALYAPDVTARFDVAALGETLAGLLRGLPPPPDSRRGRRSLPHVPPHAPSNATSPAGTTAGEDGDRRAPGR